jgi:hypothetical protein
MNAIVSFVTFLECKKRVEIKQGSNEMFGEGMVCELGKFR